MAKQQKTFSRRALILTVFVVVIICDQKLRALRYHFEALPS